MKIITKFSMAILIALTSCAYADSTPPDLDDIAEGIGAARGPVYVEAQHPKTGIDKVLFEAILAACKTEKDVCVIKCPDCVLDCNKEEDECVRKALLKLSD